MTKEIKLQDNQMVEYENLKKQEIKESVMIFFDKLKNDNVNLTENELKEFLMLCMLHKLNPLKKEIYCVKYGNKFDIITNYNEYVKRADATGLLDYYRVEVVENPDNIAYPLKAIFIGKRKDQTQELRTECRFLEYTTGQSTWKTKPFFMLEKCAIAKGMRLLFPNEISNMPYVNEELWYFQKDNDKVIKEHMESENQITLEKEEQDLSGVLDNE